MKKTIVNLLLVAVLGMVGSVCRAQQNQVEQTTLIPYAYNKYQKAVVTMLFGSKKDIEANIYYDGSRLYYRDERLDTIMEADLANVRAIEFACGDAYETIGEQMAKVEARESAGTLLSITTIDMQKMKGISGTSNDRKGENLPFFNLGSFNLDLAGSYEEGKRDLFILKTDYYFRVNNKVFPAEYKSVKENIPTEKRKAFKEKMKDRFWSWKDMQSLSQLLYYF